MSDPYYHEVIRCIADAIWTRDVELPARAAFERRVTVWQPDPFRP